jgi:peptide/nickel transport system ATP-binding protein
VQIVYQDPRASLNPRLSILASVADFATVHRDGFADSPAERAKEALDRLGLGGKLVTRRPAELSGGQLQRACIARALVVRPSLLVADEPTSALDASVQGQVLNALDALRDELAIVLISHDIDVVRFLSDDVAVMLSGAIVETGPAAVVMAEPRHEYARRLITLRAPRLDTRTEPI